VSRTLRNAGLLFAVASLSFAAYAQRDPFKHYLSVQQSRSAEMRVSEFARACVRSDEHPQKTFFYGQQGEWLNTPNLADAFSGYDTGDAQTAEVWRYNGAPRVVYLWEVDLEYERDSLVCMDANGNVVRTVSRFFPTSLDEPDEHWIYVHTQTPKSSFAVYQDAAGQKITGPHLTQEDRDFIAGERRYRNWKDFDFAAKAEQETHATP
jgi:hypothetical protein